MDQASALRSTLAAFLGISADALTPDFSLGATKLNSSIQRAMLYAQLRSQAGVSVRGMPTFKTFGEMESQLLGKTAAASASPPAHAFAIASPAIAPPPTDGEPPISCGIDIESVTSLPAAPDYWEHDFYAAHFTREEIAYCLLQSKPAVHLAGRWCLKEALKKCDPKFLTVSMNEIEVRTNPAGAPAIWDLTNGAKRRLPYAASLSHTDDFAVGTVVRLSPVASASAPPVLAANPTAPSPSIPIAKGKVNFVGIAGIFIALLAMAIAGYCVRGHH
ncbi:MAG TPA: 4'-phosphopantetheinyl transferase superfamily protein [Tepidisphaeraceae bacterium]|jgi:holo-[acyl-carrier protein] synthase|nr:4'-phosphopantetheinyl transferase superfamily protein [Tepidisphaeraceae bacterium]